MLIYLSGDALVCVTLAKKYETWIADRALVELAWQTNIVRILMQLSLKLRVTRQTSDGIRLCLKIGEGL